MIFLVYFTLFIYFIYEFKSDIDTYIELFHCLILCFSCTPALCISYSCGTILYVLKVPLNTSQPYWTCQFKTLCKDDKSNIENSTDHFCEDTRQNALADLTNLGHVTPFWHVYTKYEFSICNHSEDIEGGNESLTQSMPR